MRNPEIVKIDQLELQTSKWTRKERLYWETLREMIRRNEHLTFDERGITHMLATFSEDDINNYCAIASLNLFLRDNNEETRVHPVTGETLISTATIKRYLAHQLANGDIREEMIARIKMLVSTTEDEEFLELATFYLALDSELKI